MTDHEIEAHYAATALREAYCARARRGDVLSSADADAVQAWDSALRAVLSAGDGDLGQAQDLMQRRVNELGVGFRLAGERDERQWPVSPIPLLIRDTEWEGIANAVKWRAELCEHLLADIYGAQTLVSKGVLPAATLTGSPHYLRPLVGIAPVGGRYLHIYAADLGRGPDGEWRVLADHTRSPAGAGYALENRLAASHVFGGLSDSLNIARLAHFFADLRSGIAASCARSDPRIALLTPGRFNQSYAEQAHLARYLGLLLVEGADLTVHGDQLYLRTIEGMKRVDALWQRMDARLLDPLALDPQSAIGVPGLVDALASHSTVVANFPGSAILEAPLFAAFMAQLSRQLMNGPLQLANIATWWCGQPDAHQSVSDQLDNLVITSAFGATTLGLENGLGQLGSSFTGQARARLLADMARRPQDYVGQEIVRLSTMPVEEQGALVPRPFSLRVFAARDASGEWQVMPGGFARIGPVADIRATSIGDGTRSADVIVYGTTPQPRVSLLPTSGTVKIRRNPGTLPSRVADNLFWLGRYLERGETTLALVRAGSGGSIVGDGDPVIPAATAARIRTRLYEDGALRFDAPADFAELLTAALDDPNATASVAGMLSAARMIGGGSRERLFPDFSRILDTPFPAPGLAQQKLIDLKARFAALAGLASENMGRTAGWRFLDLGRRIERAIAQCRTIAAFANDLASGEDLLMLLDLCDVQISYRQRYSTGLALLPVRDLVGLDPFNPRSITFQARLIQEHLAALPRIRDDGMDEAPQSAATALAARVATLTAESLNGLACNDLERQLLGLSELVSDRFFLRGAEALRGSNMVLA